MFSSSASKDVCFGVGPKERHERSGGELGVRIDRIWLPMQDPSVPNLRPLSTSCLHKSSIASGVIFKRGNSIGWTAGPPIRTIWYVPCIIRSPSIQPSRADAQERIILARAAILSEGTADVFKRHPIAPMKTPAHQ